MKRNFIKSLIAILITILVVSTCFAGCSSDSLFSRSGLPEGEATQYTQTTDMKFIPSENGLDAQDYAYMWWHGGVYTKDKLLMVQTGNYGMSFDPQTAKITRLGGIQNKISSEEAASGDDRLIMNLSPIVEMEHCIRTAQGVDTKVTSVVPQYTNGEICQIKDERATALRILDSGTFQQRADVMLMVYEDIVRMRARVEFACNPDSMQYTYQAISYVNYEPGELYITMKLDPSYSKHEYVGNNTLVIYDANNNGYIFYCAEESGVVFSFNDGVLTISKQNVIMNSGVWEGFSFNIKPVCGITQQTVKQYLAKNELMVNTQMLAPHTKESGNVFYDSVTGAYTLETPDSSMFSSFNAESTMNEYERMLTTLYNPTDQPVKVLLNFYKPYKKQADYADSGPAPCLRDAVTGEPIGLPVMISRNPHKYDVNPEPLYNAMWANFYTYVTVLPGQVLQFEFTNAYAKWGETFCSSVAHLCLIGWGVNQSWIVSSIGSFGEAYCYDPDRVHGVTTATDGHALLCLKNSYGNYKKYTWTPGAGGSEYFLYYDENGNRQHIVNMKVEYEAYAPNISRFTMNGYTLDGKAKAEMTFTISRTDDLNKVIQDFKYTVLEDISYTRLAFYQAGGDNYSVTPYKTNSFGDYSGYIDTIKLSEDASQQPLGYVEGYTNIKISNDGFWTSQNDAGTYENGQYYGYSRATVLRKYHAVINGKEYTTPEVSFYKTTDGATYSIISEISAPAEANGVLKAGSVIEGTVEYMNIPMVKSMYYGPSDVIAALDASKFNTWELFYDHYVLGGKISVTATKGEVINNHPVIVKCGDTSDGIGARFTVNGGMGYVAITIRGVPDYSGWRLFEVVDGVEVMIDQSVRTNDYWQSTYDSVNNTFDLTFNVEHTGNSREYVLKKIG